MSALPKSSGTARTAVVPTTASRRKTGERVRQSVLYVVLIAISLLLLMPLLWMIITSVKTQQEVYLFPPTIIPKIFYPNNYVEAWVYPGMQFGRWTFNTLLVTVTVLVGTLLTSSLCAYGFARIPFPGRNFWFLAVLASIMLPPQVTLIPLYVLFFKIKWLDTLYPLMIPPWFGGGALNIFLLRQFFMQIPTELEDAAYMDGANRLQIWWRIFLPLSRPGLLTVAIFTFQGTWNDFYGPLIYLRSQQNYTLALGISLFNGQFSSNIQYMMAIAFLMTIPMIVVFFAAQRYFISGIVLTGLNR